MDEAPRKSRYRGVSWDKRRKKWQAQYKVKITGGVWKNLHGTLCEREEDAAEQYDA